MVAFKNFRTKMFAFQLAILLFTTHCLQYTQSEFLPSFKWYEGYKFIEKRDANRFTSHEEYVYKALYDSGICKDRMGLDTSVKAQDYLGMDLFMPFMGKYYDRKNPDLTSNDWTILTIHHLNTMVSYTYPRNRSPRPIFMGTFSETPVEVKGEKGNAIFDPVTYRLNKVCDRDPNLDHSAFITGYSINTGVAGKTKMVLVCENDIVEFPRTIANMAKDNWEPTKTPRQDKCTGQANGNENEQPKPIYCDRDQEKLMSIMALPKFPNDPEPYLIGYYSEDGGRAQFTMSREYIIVVYDSEGMNEVKGLTGVSKIDGHLAEIDIYQATDQGVEGMYFTIDGDACYFFKKYDELFEGGQLTKIPDFENPAERKFNKRNCHSYLTYIGCPMGFCYENNFDASFTIKEKDKDDDKEKTFIYFTKTMMYWKLEDKGLPLDIPWVNDAMKPMLKIKIRRASLLDFFPGLRELLEMAAEVIEYFLSQIISTFYASHPCRDYLVNKGSAVCMTRSVGAAFAVPIDGSYKIFLHETVMKKWFISKRFDYNPSMEMVDSPFKEGNKLYDAAWYNSKERRVYLFSGNQYTSLKHDDGVNNWKDKQEGPLTDFGIDKEYLDAVVNREDGIGYFFHDNWFWNVSEDNWKKSEPVEGRLSLLNFFGVRGECFANNEEDFERLISRYKEKNWTRAEERMNAIEENRKSTSEGPTKRSRLFILWFVLGGLLIVIIAYAAMYLYSKQDDKFATKRKVEYIGSRTGKKTSPPKTSSRSSKKSTLSLNKTLSTPSSKVESKM